MTPFANPEGMNKKCAIRVRQIVKAHSYFVEQDSEYSLLRVLAQTDPVI